MSVDQAIATATGAFDKAVTHLKEEFSRLQVGRASASLVDNVMVDSYGSQQPLKAIANISVPEPRCLMIQPWDKSMLGPIDKAILAAGLGLNPTNDGNVVRINIPALTEERRSDLAKHVKKLGEDAKISVRNARQDAHNAFKKLKGDNEITEDDLHTADKRLQDKVDAVNKAVDEAVAAKEKDIMTV